MPLRVSVVINTYNRAATLKKTLASFKHQSYPHFEVIVVNGPSTDSTEQILDEYKDLIKIGHCPVTNLSQSRNIGIAMAAGDIVAFIDDDAIPEARWLEEIVAGYDSAEVGGVGGFAYNETGIEYQARYTLCNRWGDNRQVQFNPTPTNNMPSIFEYISLLGTNATFHRDHLIEVGGFDEEFIYYLDETDVCLRLIDAGYKIVITEKAFVHHKSAPSYVRNKKSAMTNIYPIIRSQIYFTIKNNEGLATRAQIAGWVNHIIDHYNWQAKEYLRLDMITREEYDQGFAKLQQGMMEGLIDGYTRRRQFLTPEVMARHESPFKPYPILLPAEQRLGICFVTQEYPPEMHGGIGQYVREIAAQLAGLGHDIFVVTHTVQPPSVEFENGVWVHRINAGQHPIPTLPNGLKVPPDIWNRSYSFALEAMRIHNEHRRIDILETPIWELEGIAPLLARKGMLEGLPYPDHFENSLLVTSLHTSYKLSLPSHKEWIANPRFMREVVEPAIALEKYLMENSDLVFANTKAVIDDIERSYEMHFEPERVAQVLRGVADVGPVPRESPRDGRVIMDGGINVLFVGRLEERKGIDVLLECVPSLCEQFGEVRFFIVGDDKCGDFREPFLKRNRGARWLDRVMFTGRVDAEDLLYYYSNCDIFVAPSRFESFGLIFIEAMRFGKPVIGCRAGGMVEVIDEGVTGFLAEPGDVPSLSSELEKLLSNGDLRKTMGANARRIFETKFTAERMASQTLEIYQRVVKERLH